MIIIIIIIIIIIVIIIVIMIIFIVYINCWNLFDLWIFYVCENAMAGPNKTCHIENYKVPVCHISLCSSMSTTRWCLTSSAPIGVDGGGATWWEQKGYSLVTWQNTRHRNWIPLSRTETETEIETETETETEFHIQDIWVGSRRHFLLLSFSLDLVQVRLKTEVTCIQSSIRQGF